MAPKAKAKTKNNAPSTEPINFYELESVQKFADKSHNPFYDIHQISIPFRSVVIGSSGSGKSNFIMNLISIMGSTFNHLYIYTQAPEPLYDYLQSVISDDLLTIKYGLDDCRDFDENNYIGQSLVIFDDQVNQSSKDQACIKELYIRGRKLSVSTIYLTQSYFQVPKIIRSQCNYFFILKISGVRDLRMILSEYSLSSDVKRLQDMYKYCCDNSSITNFMTIDLQTSADKTFRKNFTEYLT
jgi:hypothetical protein